MDPVSVIASAFAADAAASAEGVASDAVKSLYAGLKKMRCGGPAAVLAQLRQCRKQIGAGEVVAGGARVTRSKLAI